MVLGIEPRDSYLSVKCSATELHLNHGHFFLIKDDYYSNYSKFENFHKNYRQYINLKVGAWCLNELDKSQMAKHT